MKKNLLKFVGLAAVSLAVLAGCGEEPIEPVEPDPIVPVTPVEPKATAPVIKPSFKVSDVTLKAGSTYTLPVVTALDYDGSNLTEEIEVEDSLESGSIADGKFYSEIAGEHTISYYVASEKTELDAEYSFNIHVIPEHWEKFAEDDDMSKLAEFGTYTEDFDDGYACQLHVGDGNNATKIIATGEAIDGNSLYIDSSKTRGNAAYSVFLVGCDQYMKKGRKANYTFEFDYKVLSVEGSASRGNVYAGLRTDQDNGDNYQFIDSNFEVGKVYHSTHSFKSKYFSESNTNVGLFFFDMNGSGAVKFVIDNIHIEVEDCPNFVAKVPSTTELLADGGFTWNFSDDSCVDMGNTLQTKVEKIEDSAIRNAIANDSHFGDYVLHLYPCNGSDFGGLNGNNLPTTYVDQEDGSTHTFTIKFDFYYYCVTEFPYLLPMANGVQSGGVVNVTKTPVSGNIKHATATFELNGQDAFKFYDGGSSMELYFGNFNVQLIETVTAKQETPVTLGGKYLNEVVLTCGGNELFCQDKVTKWSSVAQNEKDLVMASGQFTGLEPDRLNPNAAGAGTDIASERNLIYKSEATLLEGKVTYLFSWKYFISSSDGDNTIKFILYLAGSQQQFIDLDGFDTSVGYHECHQLVTIENFDVKSVRLLVNGSLGHSFSYVIFTKQIAFTVAGIPGYEDAIGGDGKNALGLINEQKTRQWGAEDGKCYGWDNNVTVAADPHFAGLTPQYLGFSRTGQDQNIEWCQNSKLHNGYKYLVKMEFYVAVAEGDTSLMINIDNSMFVPVVSSLSTGYQEIYTTLDMTKDCDFFSFYKVPGTFNLKIYVKNVSFWLVEAPVISE